MGSCWLYKIELLVMGSTHIEVSRESRRGFTFQFEFKLAWQSFSESSYVATVFYI